MANRDRREALRGAEGEAFDLLSEILTSKQWAELLKAPLERAAAEGNRGLAQKLVAAGAKIRKALHEAVRGGHEDVARDLLKSGAHPDAEDTDGNTPLHLAARGGRAEIARLLVLEGADGGEVDSKQRTPLFVAVEGGHMATGLALLAVDADVNRQFTSQNWSVVHMAAQHGLVAFLRAVIERGADLDAANRQGYTALHIATIHNQVKTIDLLIEAGSNVEVRYQSGATALHFAAIHVSGEALLALVKHGADVNAQDDLQRTPLHNAACLAGAPGAAEMVVYLLRSGADETIPNSRGKAAADVVSAFHPAHEAEDVERVRQLLANAPADRAWRRRGYLVLCRTHPGRVQLVQESSSATAGVARRTRSGAKLAKTEASGCSDPVGSSVVDGGTSGDWPSVMATVLRLQEEGIFRAIVGYL